MNYEKIRRYNNSMNVTNIADDEDAIDLLELGTAIIH